MWMVRLGRADSISSCLPQACGRTVALLHAHGQFSIAPSMVPWHAHEGKVGMCVILLVGYATLEAAEH